MARGAGKRWRWSGWERAGSPRRCSCGAGTPGLRLGHRHRAADTRRGLEARGRGRVGASWAATTWPASGVRPPWSWLRASRPAFLPLSQREPKPGSGSTPRWTSAFWRWSGTRCIGITGTNGKTTTTALLAHVLATGGLRAESAGEYRPAGVRRGAGGRPARLAGSRALVVPVARRPTPPARHGRADQPRAQSSRPVSHARGVLRGQGASSSGTPCRLGVGEQCRRCRGRGNGARVGGTHLRFSIGRRADGWFDGPGRV